MRNMSRQSYHVLVLSNTIIQRLSADSGMGPFCYSAPLFIQIRTASYPHKTGVVDPRNEDKTRVLEDVRKNKTCSIRKTTPKKPWKESVQAVWLRLQSHCALSKRFPRLRTSGSLPPRRCDLIFLANGNVTVQNGVYFSRYTLNECFIDLIVRLTCPFMRTDENYRPSRTRAKLYTEGRQRGRTRRHF